MRAAARPEAEADCAARGGGSGDASSSGRREGCRAWALQTAWSAPSCDASASRAKAMRLRACGDRCGVSLSIESPGHVSPCHAASASPSTRRGLTTRIAPLGERGGDAGAAATAGPPQKGARGSTLASALSCTPPLSRTAEGSKRAPREPGDPAQCGRA